MTAAALEARTEQFVGLPANFNKKKNLVNYAPPRNEYLIKMQNMSRQMCLNSDSWAEVKRVEAWMISAETATFMKCGGLGMVASELPENFNRVFANGQHKISIITPLYLGNTGKKKAELVDDVYYGAEGKSVVVKKIKTIKLLFNGKQNKLKNFSCDVYYGNCKGVDYYFLYNTNFFSINPAPDNPSGQGGCYVLNEFGIDEVERFAFFSKAVYCLLENLVSKKDKNGNMELLPRFMPAEWIKKPPTSSAKFRSFILHTIWGIRDGIIKIRRVS